jgi:D-alanyl-D-alanine carboxypeptidase (penicillin-binding protein 5/6)
MASVFSRLILAICIVFSPLAFADNPFPVTPVVHPKAPTAAANAYLLIDYHSGQVLAENNSELKVEPASLTKMMTMYVIDNEIRSGKLRLDEEIQISKTAWQAPGSRMFVKVDTKVPVSELIKGIIIQSGNDASIAMAEHIAGSEQAFADLMNGYAQMIGMKDSHFMNATGLPDPNHYTTAKDLAILAKAMIKNFPETYKLYSEKEFIYNNIKQVNRNQLLWRNSAVDGIKTGHTDAAGYCLVASGTVDHMRLIAVILGAKSAGQRTEEANKLLTWGFKFYETNLVQRANTKLQEAKIWKGKKQKLEVGFIDDLFITSTRGSYKKYAANIKMQEELVAPIQRGQVVGTYVVQDQHNQPILEIPIVALQDVGKGNIYQRGRDYIKLGIKKMLGKITS